MKAIKSTGLVPVRFLQGRGVYSKDQVAGLDPAEVKRLQASKTPVISTDVDLPEGTETIEIDDETLVAAPPVPGLGGYDHQPPLASNAVPGRNRIQEPPIRGAAFGLETYERGAAEEDHALARGVHSDAVKSGAVSREAAERLTDATIGKPTDAVDGSGDADGDNDDDTAPRATSTRRRSQTPPAPPAD